MLRRFLPSCSIAHIIIHSAVLRSDNAEDEDTCWAEIFSSEKEPSADCFCSLDETGFTLFVSHFTNFTVVGECDQKLFNLEAYHSSDLKSSEDFKIRIYCIPDFQKSSKVLYLSLFSILNGYK